MKSKRKEDILNLRRAQLVEAAFALLSRRGYANFTIKDVAVEAELSTGLVHYYFKNKDELLLTLVKETEKKLQRLFFEAVSKAGDPLEWLNIFLDQAFRLVVDESDHVAILLDFWSKVNHDDRIKMLSRKLFNNFRKYCSNILELGIEQGKFKDMDVSFMSIMIISMLEGTFVQYIVDPNAFSFEDISQRLKDQIITMVLIEGEVG